MKKLTRLEETILFILKFAAENGKENLSKFEIMKLIYLVEINSQRFIGESFTNETKFVRDKNGPISYDIYKSLEELNNTELIKIWVEENKEYGYPRYCHALNGDLPELTFTDSEIVYLNSLLSDYVSLTSRKLKDIAYQTEPMKKVQLEEKEEGVDVLKGKQLDMKEVPLDEDILSAIMA